MTTITSNHIELIDKRFPYDYDVHEMRIRTKCILFLIPFFAVFLYLCPAAAGKALTAADIETKLTSYDEPGYKFLEKTDAGIWKVLYARPGWEFGWEVAITTTSDNPDTSLVVIGTSLVTIKDLTPDVMMYLLDENSFDTNPGNYSIFREADNFTIQYSVKFPQSLLNEEVLLEAIGFVAGYSNSHVKKLEAMLPAEAQPEAGEQQPPASDKTEPQK